MSGIEVFLCKGRTFKLDRKRLLRVENRMSSN